MRNIDKRIMIRLPLGKIKSPIGSLIVGGARNYIENLMFSFRFGSRIISVTCAGIYPCSLR